MEKNKYFDLCMYLSNFQKNMIDEKSTISKREQMQIINKSIIKSKLQDTFKKLYNQGRKKW